MLSAAMPISRCRASFVAQAMWGVRIQFGASLRGLSVAIGSRQTTSAPYAPTLPHSSACRISASFTSGPRAVLMIITPSFIRARVCRFIRFSVSSVKGVCNEMTSDPANSCYRSTGKTPLPAGILSGLRVQHNTFIPNDWAICATVRPILPYPKIPSVFPSSSTSGAFQ